MGPKIRLIFISLLIIGFSLPRSIISPVSAAEDGFPFDWEVKAIPSGGKLSLSLPAVGISDGTQITFNVFQRNGSGNGTINIAGAQGGWDLQGYIAKSCGQDGIPGEDQLDKHFGMLATIGVKWANLSFSWPYVEKKQGKFVFDKFYDPVFRVAKKYNINLVPNIVNTPRWATVVPCQTSPVNTCADNTRCIPRDIAGKNGSATYNNFLKTVVERYKQHGSYYSATGEPDNGYGITHWIIWNEPDNPFDTFWADCTGFSSVDPGADINDRSAPRASLSSYADLFSGAYDAIKEIDRNAKVVMAGLVYYDRDNSLRQIYTRFNATGGSKPDILNIHAYQPCKYTAQGGLALRPTTGAPYCLFRDFVTGFARTAKELDPTKKVWLGEFGPTLNYTQAWQVEFLSDAVNAFSYIRQYWNSNFDQAFWWPSKGNVPSQLGDPGTILGLMHPCFEPRQTYFKVGQLNGAIGSKTSVSGIVENGQIKTTSPISFGGSGKYIVIATNPNEMVINKPIAVYVGINPPTAGPTQPPEPTPTAVNPPTATPTIPYSCVCQTDNLCHVSCNFDKYPDIPYSETISCQQSSLAVTTPSQQDKNGYCQRSFRTKGDANGDGVVNEDDYIYYLRAVNGLTLPVNANPDFNGDGVVNSLDLQIFTKTFNQ